MKSKYFRPITNRHPSTPKKWKMLSKIIQKRLKLFIVHSVLIQCLHYMYIFLIAKKANFTIIAKCNLEIYNDKPVNTIASTCTRNLWSDLSNKRVQHLELRLCGIPKWSTKLRNIGTYKAVQKSMWSNKSNVSLAFTAWAGHLRHSWRRNHSSSCSGWTGHSLWI